MKKIIKYITLIVVLSATLQSCTKDFLNLEPTTNQSEANFYKTEADAFVAVVAIYDALSVQNWQFVPIMSDIFSDDAFTGGSSSGDMSQWQEHEAGIMTPENQAASDLWQRCYTGIYRANLYLEKQEQIEWVTDGLKERFEAEAKFLRAYFYWDLVRHYGWVPVLTEVLPDIEDYKDVPQSTPQEVFSLIAADLIAATEKLPAEVDATEKGRATKYAAEALMARIYLFYEGFAKTQLSCSGNWSDGTTDIDKIYVQQALTDIIENGPYMLLSDYADVFAWGNENNAESIFEWQYSEKANSGDWSGWNINGNFSVIFYGPRNSEGTSPYAGVEGWSFCIPSWSLVNEFEAGDYRFDVTIFNAETELTSYTPGFQNTGYFMKKNMGLKQYEHTAAGDVPHNWRKNYIDIRYADVLLMVAELYVDDNPALALDYLNQVRTRAMGPSAALSSISIDDIFHERRVELAGEGSRKWDLLRRGLDYTETKINESFDVSAINPSNLQDFSGRNFVKNTWGMFPIPGSEIRNANAGVLQQYVPAY